MFLLGSLGGGPDVRIGRLLTTMVESILLSRFRPLFGHKLLLGLLIKFVVLARWLVVNKVIGLWLILFSHGLLGPHDHVVIN